jgi:hypothetical protein
MNASGGLYARNATVTARRSTFTQNGGPGFSVTDSTATVDQCVASFNTIGLFLDSGLFDITNNFVYRNYNASSPTYGIYIYASSPGARIEFNTVADNSDNASVNVGAGISCDIQTGSTASFPNNIIIRNRRQTAGSTCVFPSSLVYDSGADISVLKLKSPDVSPYDYHITAGSSAIDIAVTSTVDHDYDGDARPAGAQRDVGADEVTP